MTPKTERHILRSVPNTPLHTTRPGRQASLHALATAGLLLVVGAACEPASVTEARDQLKRGGERLISLTLPVTLDSAIITDFLDSTVQDTVVGGVIGIPIDPQSLAVPVVPSFLEFDPVPSNAVDFGEFEDAVRDAIIASSPAQVTLVNSGAQVATLSNVVIGVVDLNPNGSVPLDGSGNPIYDTDASGAPRTLGLADPGSSVITIGAGATTVLDTDAATIVDGVVDLLLAGARPAVVATGNGAGPLGAIVSTTIEMVALFDLILPQSGVGFSSNTTQDGVELAQGDADQVADRITVATFTAITENRSPFGATVEVAIAEGDLGMTDVFNVPGSVVISGMAVGAGTVDANGLVTAANTDTVVISITGAQIRPFLGELFTVTTRIRLVPSGASGRGAVRPQDVVVFNASAGLTIVGGEDQ